MGKEHELRNDDDDDDDDNDGDICNLFTFASNTISHSPRRQNIAVLHKQFTLFKLDTANKTFLTSEGSVIENGLREFFPELLVPDAYCIWCQIVHVKKDFEQGRRI